MQSRKNASDMTKCLEDESLEKTQQLREEKHFTPDNTTGKCTHKRKLSPES
jgi:hypothetical protein